MIKSRYFTTIHSLLHENPLGLPVKGHRGAPSLPRKGAPGKIEIPYVKKIIAISSAKGGVGKSTCAVNLAIAAKQQNLKVGLLDADLFGPSIPKLMNLDGKPELDNKGAMIPLFNYGVHCMSMGNLIEPEQAVVWRGMMVMKALQQLIYQTRWPELDLLVIDMPPGTGDTQLTISQLVPLNGAVIVSTPQDLALIDVRKGITMFQKVNVKILGILQNMSSFQCPNCKHTHNIFGNNGALELSKELNFPFLGDLPLSLNISKYSDRGTPITIMDPKGWESQLYLNAIKTILKST